MKKYPVSLLLIILASLSSFSQDTPLGESQIQRKKDREMRYRQIFDSRQNKLTLHNYRSTGPDGFDPNMLLVLAVKHNNFGFAVTALFKRANPEQRIGDRSLLIHAINKGYQDIALLLIDKGASVTACGPDRANALHHAVYYNYPNLVAEILFNQRNNSDIDLQTADGSTALMIAAVRNSGESADILLKRSPDLNLKNNDGKTAVMLAVEQDNTGMVIKLAGHGADLNLRDNIGCTPLMKACRKNISGTDMDRYLPLRLLELGAGTSPRANDGSTALRIAISNGAFDAAVVLMEKGATE